MKQSDLSTRWGSMSPIAHVLLERPWRPLRIPLSISLGMEPEPSAWANITTMRELEIQVQEQCMYSDSYMLTFIYNPGREGALLEVDALDLRRADHAQLFRWADEAFIRS